MTVALVKYDSLDEYYAQRDQMRAEGLCAFGWTVRDTDGFGIVVACVKTRGHRGDHRAWGGYTAVTAKTPKKKK